MSEINTNRKGPHVAAQVTAAWADFELAARSGHLAGALSAQDRAYFDAMGEMQTVRNFVGSPEHILGSPATKHGEIAEQVHVGVRRAADALHGRPFGAEIENIPRTGPIDYRIDGVDVQSKYINGLRNTLDHIKGHADKYPEFSEGGGQYHIPKDQNQQLKQLRQSGSIEDHSPKSAETIQSKLDDLHETTGRCSEELISPGEGTYAEVQQGRVNDTIRNREEGLSDKNEELKQAARTDNGPSLGGLGQAAALGAGAGAGVRFGQGIWVKYREGKNPFKGDFSSTDWKDIGVETGKGAGTGAVAGGAMYALTNSSDLAAPFAGALVSSLMGVGGLLQKHHSGEINADEFVELSQIIAADAAVIGLASMAGQALIPIPVLGAFLGSLTGRVVTSAIKGSLGTSEKELLARLEAYEKKALQQLDEKELADFNRLATFFETLESLATIAFDEKTNTELRLETSVQIAETVGVTASDILRSTTELDILMNVETQMILDGPELTQSTGYFDRMVRSQMCLFACMRVHLCVVFVCKCVVGV